jgi:hypothetical protein
MKLSNNERGVYTDFVKLTWEDLKTIGNGGTKKLATIPAGGAVSIVSVTNTVDIAGTTTLVFDVGVAAEAEAFIKDLDVDAMTVGVPTSNTGVDFTQAAGTTTFEAGLLPARAVSTATAINLTVTDANIANITAGEVVFGIGIVNLSQYA